MEFIMKILDIKNKPIGRATGCTFRLITKALHEASSGKIVFVVCPNPSRLGHVRQKMLDVSDAYFGNMMQVDQHGRDAIIFPNNGKINLMTESHYDYESKQTNLNGFGGEVIVLWEQV